MTIRAVAAAILAVSITVAAGAQAARVARGSKVFIEPN
jgi:hypothetical protein